MSELKKRKRGKVIGSNIQLFKCFQCKKGNEKSPQLTITEITNLRSDIKCNDCEYSWTICLQCQVRYGGRNHIANAAKHLREFHPQSVDPYSEIYTGKQKMNTINEHTNIDFTSSFDVIGSSSSSSSTLKSYECCAKKSDLSDSKLGDDSQFYFNNIITNGKYGGIQALTAQAFAGHRTDELANKEEALYHLQVGNFCQTLSLHQQKTFASILSKTRIQDQFQVTRAPMSIFDINKFYTKNKNSIFQNLPSPTPMVFNNHVYVSLESVIDHFLAFGFDVNSTSLNDAENY